MKSGIVRVGVVGTGALGAHHARVFAGLAEARLATVFDLDAEKARSAGERFGARVAASLEDFIEDIDAAVVAVPTVSHAGVSTRLIEAGR